MFKHDLASLTRPKLVKGSQHKLRLNLLLNFSYIKDSGLRRSSFEIWDGEHITTLYEKRGKRSGVSRPSDGADKLSEY